MSSVPLAQALGELTVYKDGKMRWRIRFDRLLSCAKVWKNTVTNTSDTWIPLYVVLFVFFMVLFCFWAFSYELAYVCSWCGVDCMCWLLQLIDELKPGGRLIIPVGPQNRTQKLMQVDKGEDGTVTQRKQMSVSFVPLTSKKDQCWSWTASHHFQPCSLLNALPISSNHAPISSKCAPHLFDRAPHPFQLRSQSPPTTTRLNHLITYCRRLL